MGAAPAPQQNQEWDLNGATELAWLKVNGDLNEELLLLWEERGSCVLC